MTTCYAQKLNSHMTCSRCNILFSRFYIAYFKLCHEAFWCILMSEHCENRILSFLIVSNVIWLEHSKKGMRESKQTIQQQKPKQEAQNYTSCAHPSTLLTLVPKPVLLTGLKLRFSLCASSRVPSKILMSDRFALWSIFKFFKIVPIVFLS